MILGCASRAPIADRFANRTDDAVEVRPESRKLSFLEIELAGKAAFLEMLRDEERLLYTQAAAKRVEALRNSGNPVVVSVAEFERSIARSRVVFLSDVHEDTLAQESNERATRWLESCPGSVGRFGLVGLEFIYDEWTDAKISELTALVEAEFGFDSNGSATTAWFVGLARSGGARIVPFNDPAFHSRRCLDEAGLPSKYFWYEYSELVHQRDLWAAERINGVEGRAIVVYGRVHVVSGNLPRLVPRSCSVITYDPELWTIVASKIDCSTLPTDAVVVVELAPDLFLAHFP